MDAIVALLVLGDHAWHFFKAFSKEFLFYFMLTLNYSIFIIFLLWVEVPFQYSVVNLRRRIHEVLVAHRVCDILALRFYQLLHIQVL